MDDSFITIPFSPGGVGYLNNFLGEKFVLGELVPTAVGAHFPQQPFGFTGPDIPAEDPLTPFLTVVVPEPSAFSLLLIAGLPLLQRRKRD